MYILTLLYKNLIGEFLKIKSILSYISCMLANNVTRLWLEIIFERAFILIKCRINILLFFCLLEIDNIRKFLIFSDIENCFLFLFHKIFEPCIIVHDDTCCITEKNVFIWYILI